MFICGVSPDDQTAYIVVSRSRRLIPLIGTSAPQQPVNQGVWVSLDVGWEGTRWLAWAAAVAFSARARPVQGKREGKREEGNLILSRNNNV